MGPLTGWLAYAYSRTEYKTQRINQGDSFFPRHDRSSTVNLVANIDLKNMLRKISGRASRQHKGNWKLSFNGVYTTGQPITEPGSAYFVFSAPDDPSPGLEYAPTRINNIRLPYYARLDISLTYKRRFSWGSFSPYVQLFNAGNRRNVWFVNYDFNDGVPDPNTLCTIVTQPMVLINRLVHIDALHRAATARRRRRVTPPPTILPTCRPPACVSTAILVANVP